MNPVAKAVWFIESHFMQELTLDDVANAVGVSRYHMSRVFAARLDAGTVSVYLGDGKGGFAGAEGGSPFAAGNNPEDLALGNFNEDTLLDIAIANHETEYLTLLLGDGKRGLRPAPGSRIPVPSRPHPHGVAGDFNGDSHLDVAVESRDENAVLVLFGNGKGAFRGNRSV